MTIEAGWPSNDERPVSLFRPIAVIAGRREHASARDPSAAGGDMSCGKVRCDRSGSWMASGRAAGA